MAEYRFEDIAINSTEKKKPVESDKEHYLGLEHLDSGTFKVSRFGSEVAPIGDKLIMKKGDVLFGKRRAYQKKVAIAPFDGIFSAHGMVLRPKEDVIDKNFFPLFIASDYFLDAAIKISVGSLSPTINWRDLKELKFNLPELDEQKKLAEVLWQIVGTMESYKKLLAKTDEMVKAKFVEMFGLCEHKKLAEITDIVLGQSPDSDTYNDKGDGLPFYQGKTEFGDKYVTPKVYCSTPLKIAKPNDVLLSVRAPVGAVNMTKDKCCIGRGLAALSFKDSKANDFLFYALKVCEADIERMGQGATFKAITGEQVKNIMIPVAEENLKNTFINFFQKSEESKAAIQTSLDSLSAVYKKIIAENLGGSN